MWKVYITKCDTFRVLKKCEKCEDSESLGKFVYFYIVRVLVLIFVIYNIFVLVSVI